MTKIQQIPVEKLDFDRENPRLVEYGIEPTTGDDEMIEVLSRIMSVSEIILSIYNSGFFENEALIAIPNGDRFTTIEGNRRLAAVRIIRDFVKYKEFYPSILPEPSKELIASLYEIPVLVEDSRDQSWQYIGFKHVNGSLKWTSYAKAEYIAQVHNKFHVPLSNIALQIGDSNKIVQRLYQSLMVLDQAERGRVFDRKNIYPVRLYFSHLYTGLQYEGIREFVGLKDIAEESSDPVDKLEATGEFLGWLYGNKREEIKPVIQSQNPDLRNLDAVVKSDSAIETLRKTRDLSIAFEISQPDESKFFQSLNDAKLALYKSLQYVATGYKGDEEKLRMSGTVADMSDNLYSTMEKIYESTNQIEKKQRLTER
jgi:hypothetical protein